MDDHPTVNHLSLCAGIGGIDLGLRAVVERCRTIAYVEIEAFAIAHLVAQMEAGGLDSAPVFTDLHGFPWQQFSGCVDIISGGFPCQPFSNAGKRKGVEDSRHLWPTIARGIDTVRPACVFFENVDGITTAKSPGFHSVLHHVLSDMEEMGYRTTAGCFTASEVGAPHLRKRWFILGVCNANNNSKPTGAINAEASGLQGDLVNTIGGEGDAQHHKSNGHNKQERGTARTRRKSTRSTDAEASTDSLGRSSAAMADPSDLVDATGDEHQRNAGVSTRKDGSSSTGGQANRRDEIVTERCTEELGDATSHGCGKGRAGKKARYRGRWPARPGEQQHDWEPPRTLEPSVGGSSNGIRHRVDRLRALGNAVVPAVAARAFSTLWRELMA